MNPTVTFAGAKADRMVGSFSVLFEHARPDPEALLASVISYVNKRAQASVEGIRAQWTGDWLRRRDVWLKRMGKLLTPAEVTQVSPSMKTTAAVHKARHDGRLLAIEVGDRVYFPEFQFGDDGAPAPWVRELGALMPDSDAMLQFLAGGRGGSKGRSYGERLRDQSDGSIVEQMLATARRQALAEAR
jgi:hypothetical protein